ncbi:partial Sialidase, partial [Methylococcales bacterium]
FNTPGTFTVSFTVTDGLGIYDPTPAVRTISVQSTSTVIPKTNWSLRSVDSQELVGENGAAINAFDGNVNTRWHTKWSSGSDPLPHEIQINLGAVYNVSGFRYLPNQINGRIKQWEFYVSTDGTNWGSAVATGTFVNDATEKAVFFTQKSGRYVRLRALSEVNGNPWTHVAEITVLQN